jgi:hypothetical protein
MAELTAIISKERNKKKKKVQYSHKGKLPITITQNMQYKLTT